MTRRDPGPINADLDLAGTVKGRAARPGWPDRWAHMRTAISLFLPFLAFSCPLLLAFLGLFSSNPNSVISAPGVHTVRGLNGVLPGLQLFQIESGRKTRNRRTGDRFNYPLRWFHFNECCLLLPARHIWTRLFFKVPTFVFQYSHALRVPTVALLMNYEWEQTNKQGRKTISILGCVIKSTQLNKLIKTMITVRETKRMSLSDSNVHKLAGNAHFCRFSGGHETFFGANYLRLEADNVPCRWTRMVGDCKKWK